MYLGTYLVVSVDWVAAVKPGVYWLQRTISLDLPYADASPPSLSIIYHKMDQQADWGLLNITLFDSQDSITETLKETAECAQESKASRNVQSEIAFEEVRAGYRPRVENGEVRRRERAMLFDRPGNR